MGPLINPCRLLCYPLQPFVEFVVFDVAFFLFLLILSASLVPEGYTRPPPPSSVFSLSSDTRMPDVTTTASATIVDMPPPPARQAIVPHVDMDTIAERVVTRVIPGLLVQHAETIQSLCEARYKNTQLQLKRELGERALVEQREVQAQLQCGK